MGNLILTNKWNIYRFVRDDEIVSIRLDLGVKELVPIASYEHLVNLCVNFSTKADMVDIRAKEMDDFYNLEEELIGTLSEYASAVLVGIETTVKQRIFSFYAVDNEKLEEEISKLLDTHFSGKSYTFLTDKDEKWEYYNYYLYPSGEQIQDMWNQEMLRKLEVDGIDLDEAQPIKHYLYVHTAKYAEELVIELQEEGLLDGKITYVEKLKRYEVSFVKVQAPISVMEITLFLYYLAQENEADYAGWEILV